MSSTKHIVLRNHRAYLIVEKWIPPVRDENDEVTAPGRIDVTETEIFSLVDYLGMDVSTGDDFTFGDLWELIIPDTHLYNRLFSYELGRHSLEAFHDDYRRPTEDKDLLANRDPNNSMEYLEIYIAYDYEEDYTQDDPTIMKLTRSPEFHGKGKNTSEWDNGAVSDVGWAVEFTSLSDLKQYPFRVTTSVQIYNTPKVDGKYTCIPLLDGSTTENVTVYDVIRGIFNEITFAGDPTHRDAAMCNILDGVKEAKEVLKKAKEGDADNEDHTNI